MSIFSRKKNTEPKTAEKPIKKVSESLEPKVESKAVAAQTTKLSGAVFAGTFHIKRPRISEKASFLAEKDRIYVFEVDKNSNKQVITDTVKELYKVKPVKVRIAPIPAKRVFVRGKFGVKKGGKKAYVYLKKGEKLELI